MDALTFTSETIKSLAWPVTVLLLTLMLRKPIAELIPSLRKLKYNDIEMEFAEAIAELKADAELAQPNPAHPLASSAPESSHLLRLVNFSTRAAILEAWVDVESAAAEVAASFWSQPPGDIFKNSPTLGEYLLKCKVIDENQLGTFNKLRELRDKSTQAAELNLSKTDARSYVELATALAAHIRAT